MKNSNSFLNKPTFTVLIILLISLVSCNKKNSIHPGYKQQEETASLNNQFQDSETAKQITGKAINIIDGDTYDLLMPNKEKIRIRMEGIDAPEGGMPFYRRSKNYLKELIDGKTVNAVFTGKDDSNRDLAFTFLTDGREAGTELLRAGLAWHYKNFNQSDSLAKIEQEAKEKGLGLWSEDNPVPPWIIRRLRRQGISTKNKLNPFSERSFVLNRNQSQIDRGDISIKTSFDSDNLILTPFKNDIELPNLPLGFKADSLVVHIADYNMDNLYDFLVFKNEREFFYFLYNPQQNRFEKADWKIRIWQLNKSEKQLLTLPIRGDKYVGEVDYYDLKENNKLKRRIGINYYYKP